jgi:hypothetical protein
MSVRKQRGFFRKVSKKRTRFLVDFYFSGKSGEKFIH